MDRKKHWDSVYKNKSPLEVSWFQRQPVISLALIGKYSNSSDDSIIDVGGGASTLSDNLLDGGYRNITLLDISTNALSASKKRLGSKSDFVEWVVEDVTCFIPERKFDIWHDRAVFHFLTDKSDRDKYRQVLDASVKAGGHVIIATFEMGGPDKCSGLDIVQYDAAKLDEELGDGFTLVDEKQEKHVTPAGGEQEFGYYVFIKNG